MGVSGSGKTTVGKRLAVALDAEFVDGDDLHTDAARAKMAAGHALTDEDRWPWLDRVGAALADRDISRIVACSALKRAYRDRIRAAAGPNLRFVYLAATPEAMRKRVAARRGHYMPASLVDSQFATLEAPKDEPDVIEDSAESPVDSLVAELTLRLRG
jgi:carbohydrate kinase (thermoresistant glucokinase family)